jgi:hypothetical protein
VTSIHRPTPAPADGWGPQRSQSAQPAVTQRPPRSCRPATRFPDGPARLRARRARLRAPRASTGRRGQDPGARPSAADLSRPRHCQIRTRTFPRRPAHQERQARPPQRCRPEQPGRWAQSRQRRQRAQPEPRSPRWAQPERPRQRARPEERPTRWADRMGRSLRPRDAGRRSGPAGPSHPGPERNTVRFRAGRKARRRTAKCRADRRARRRTG